MKLDEQALQESIARIREQVREMGERTIALEMQERDVKA